MFYNYFCSLDRLFINKYHKYHKDRAQTGNSKFTLNHTTLSGIEMPKALLSFSDESWANAGVAEPIECKFTISKIEGFFQINFWGKIKL